MTPTAGRGTRDPSTPPAWKIVLSVEVVVLVIALVSGVTPSKTGSDWNPAELFVEAPGYLHEVVFVFLFLNALLAVLGGLFWLRVRRRGP